MPSTICDDYEEGKDEGICANCSRAKVLHALDARTCIGIHRLFSKGKAKATITAEVIFELDLNGEEFDDEFQGCFEDSMAEALRPEVKLQLLTEGENASYRLSYPCNPEITEDTVESDLKDEEFTETIESELRSNGFDGITVCIDDVNISASLQYCQTFVPHPFKKGFCLTCNCPRVLHPRAQGQRSNDDGDDDGED